MKYVVDQINEQVCVLESLDNGELLEIGTDSLPDDISEGNILVFDNGSFIREVVEEKERKMSLRERMERLKKTDVLGGIW